MISVGPVNLGDRLVVRKVCILLSVANCAAASANSGERHIAGDQSPASMRSVGQ